MIAVEQTGTNWFVDKEGYISKIEPSLLGIDRLFAANDKVLEIHTGILEKYREKSVKITDEIGIERIINGHTITANNKETATQLYDFLKVNTDVEWVFITYNGCCKNILTTSHSNNSEGVFIPILKSIFNKGYNLNKLEHNHPVTSTNTSDSGKIKQIKPGASLNDMRVKWWAARNYPNLSSSTSWRVYDTKMNNTYNY